MPFCSDCGWEFTNPEGVRLGVGDVRERLCPKHVAVFYAEKDQREAAARDEAQKVCARQGHVPYESFVDNNCARCGDPVPR
jgi:hypothetical protein